MVPSMNEVIKELRTFDRVNEYDVSYICQKYHLTYRQGLYKYCILHPRWSHVIKISKLIGNINSCLDECNVYNEAQKFNIQKILLKSEYIYEFPNSQGMSIQEKADFTHYQLRRGKARKYELQARTLTEAQVREVKKFFFYPKFPDLWLKLAIIKYGRTFVRELATWTKDSKISDLHYQNVGYKNGAPVIIDYAKN